MVRPEVVRIMLEALKANPPDGYADSAYYSMGWEDACDAAIERVEDWDDTGE